MVNRRLKIGQPAYSVLISSTRRRSLESQGKLCDRPAVGGAGRNPRPPSKSNMQSGHMQSSHGSESLLATFQRDSAFTPPAPRHWSDGVDRREGAFSSSFRRCRADHHPPGCRDWARRRVGASSLRLLASAVSSRRPPRILPEAKTDQRRSSCAAAASIASRTHVRDDRETPLIGTGHGRYGFDLGETRSEIFFQTRLDS